MKPAKPASKAERTEESETLPAGQAPDESGAAGVDARDDPGKRKENRDRLGVDEDHETPDMKKHHRGTFP